MPEACTPQDTNKSIDVCFADVDGGLGSHVHDVATFGHRANPTCVGIVATTIEIVDVIGAGLKGCAIG